MYKNKDELKEYRTVKKSRKGNNPKSKHKHEYKDIVLIINKKMGFLDKILTGYCITGYCIICGKISHSKINAYDKWDKLSEEEKLKYDRYMCDSLFIKNINEANKI